jgi:ubiquinone/menaquinone biosynthesis C-methylase UbiE
MTERGTPYDAAELEFSMRVEGDPLKIGLSQQLLARLPLRPDEVLVDLGCGPGQFLARCNSVHPQAGLIGVDASMGNLRMLKINCPNALAVRADIGKGIALADNTADVVTMNFVASEIGGLGTVLSETSRILKPGGLLAMTNTSRESDKKTNKFRPDKISVCSGSFDDDDDEVRGTYNLRTADGTIPVPHYMRTAKWYITNLLNYGLEMIPGGIQQVVDMDHAIIEQYRFAEWFHPEAETIYARKLPDNMKFIDKLPLRARLIKQAISSHFPYDSRFIFDAVFPNGADTTRLQGASHVTMYHPLLNSSLPIDPSILKKLGISQMSMDALPTSGQRSLRQS